MAPQQPKAKSPLQPQPSFAQRVLAAYAWARVHSRPVLVGGGALALLTAASVYYLSYRRQLEAAASVELAQVRETVFAGNTNLAIADLQRFLAQYGETEHAREARVMLAVLLIRAGQPEEAREVVQRVARNPGSDPVAARAGFVMGAALEASGDTAAAIEHYLALASALEMGFQKREALASAGRLQAARKDFPGAAATYRMLLSLTPETSVERSIYAMRLAEATTAAQAHRAADGEGTGDGGGP